MVAIEREFAVAIPEGKVDHEVFHSIRTLALWVAERLAQRDLREAWPGVAAP